MRGARFEELRLDRHNEVEIHGRLARRSLVNRRSRQMPFQTTLISRNNLYPRFLSVNRAGLVIDWLHATAKALDRKIMVRLVKGAYWDSEIKRAQVEGLPGFPLFTSKTATDVSYIALAKRLIG